MKILNFVTPVIAGAIVASVSSYIAYKQTKKLLTKINYRKSATGRWETPSHAMKINRKGDYIWMFNN